MLILNEQDVFDALGNINSPKKELVLSLNLDVNGRPTSAHTATETLYQFLSEGKNKISAWNLVGVSHTTFELRKDKFDAFLEICQERLDTDYKYVTWFDVVMILFILQYTNHDNSLRTWAKSHLDKLVARNHDIVPYIQNLASTKVAPVV
jgi:hypothetical protein